MAGINKVVLGDQVLMDLSGDTVTPQTLLKGATAYMGDGTPITGIYDPNGPNGLIGKRIYSNGTYLASEDKAVGYNRVDVDVSPELENLYVSHNGTYRASDSGYDGFASVEVDIEIVVSGYKTYIDGVLQTRNLNFVTIDTNKYRLVES